MTLKTVNTEHMSDVELAAKRVAEDVRTLQANAGFLSFSQGEG